MDMRIDATGSNNLAFTGNCFCARSNHNINTGLGIGLPALPIPESMRPFLIPISALMMPQ